MFLLVSASKKIKANENCFNGTSKRENRAKKEGEKKSVDCDCCGLDLKQFRAQRITVEWGKQRDEWGGKVLEKEKRAVFVCRFAGTVF